MIPYWLAADFFSWLWWLSEEGQKVEMEDMLVEVIVDSSISFKAGVGDEKASYKGKISEDAKKSFGLGKSIDTMTVVLKIEDRDYEFRLGKGGLRFYKVNLPLTSASGDSREEALHENLLLLEEAEGLLDALFLQYLDRRCNDSEELLSQIQSLEASG